MIFHCPHCGIKVAPAHRTCPTCSERMIRSCPACAEDISVKATECKYCGEVVAPESGRRAPAARPSAQAVSPGRREGTARPDIEFIEEPARVCAWENPKQGVASRWWSTWKESNFHPTRFFQNLPKDSGHRWPVGFANGLWAQVLFVAVVVAAGALGVAAVQGHSPEAWVLWLGAAFVVVGIPLYFFMVTAALYVGSFFWHILLAILGAKGGFEGTLRIVGYSSGTQVWNLVPLIGPAIGLLLKGILYYRGFREVHGLSKGKAFFATLVPILLITGVIVAGVALALSHGHPGHSGVGAEQAF